MLCDERERIWRLGWLRLLLCSELYPIRICCLSSNFEYIGDRESERPKTTNRPTIVSGGVGIGFDEKPEARGPVKQEYQRNQKLSAKYHKMDSRQRKYTYSEEVAKFEV